MPTPATSQIRRLKNFVFDDKMQFEPLTTPQLELAAQLWVQSRNAGLPTADPKSLDMDVIPSAQCFSLGLPTSEYVVATTNPNHIALFVSCDLWANIAPGS